MARRETLSLTKVGLPSLEKWWLRGVWLQPKTSPREKWGGSGRENPFEIKGNVGASVNGWELAVQVEGFPPRANVVWEQPSRSSSQGKSLNLQSAVWLCYTAAKSSERSWMGPGQTIQEASERGHSSLVPHPLADAQTCVESQLSLERAHRAPYTSPSSPVCSGCEITRGVTQQEL